MVSFLFASTVITASGRYDVKQSPLIVFDKYLGEETVLTESVQIKTSLASQVSRKLPDRSDRDSTQGM